MREAEAGRPIKIAGMAYAPTNEQGVVFLFGRLAPRLGFHIEQVQTKFPDCTARRRGKTCRIEFEYRASNYNHPQRGADVIVCWDNDWECRPQQYRHLEIIDLKRYVGALPRVYHVGCDETASKDVDKYSRLHWNVPLTTQVGDLVAIYRNKPASEIRDIWRVTGNFDTHERWGFEADIRLVARLSNPLTYKDLKSDPSTRNLAIVRRRFMGKSDITDDWPLLHERIVGLNPKVKKALRDFRIE